MPSFTYLPCGSMYVRCSTTIVACKTMDPIHHPDTHHHSWFYCSKLSPHLGHPNPSPHPTSECIRWVRQLTTSIQPNLADQRRINLVPGFVTVERLKMNCTFLMNVPLTRAYGLSTMVT
ncbi:hypothetical protein VOLCADRAFT_97892 [Volvox carteri f. nagariensis]|uniref:Uncharacterized protein n=1 Tax=Volvox carteri f. nagariensis TaxID=3068 RepID=D8UDX5_VOLCA|nr:uncharacterized protein VOLCADRAFT_97892 [Volvox carteri f. nagariensis]EFJ42122.1 hypothetical protein VOLCADRAFT_97892 [Volvox carteri f. nagariensis]|eukprot:XP_002956819.1 hypothetical protein VOLCADRAFT_97892 [Volvox carteri f. nagariensis]